MSKIRISLIIIFSLITLNLWAQGDGSLEYAVNSLKGSEQLTFIENRYRQLWAGNDPKTQCEVIDLYVDRADKQKNHTLGATARMLKIDLYRNYNMSDSLDSELRRGLQFMKSHDMWNYYYVSWAVAIQHYVGQGKINKALYHTMKMYNEASVEKSKYGLSISAFLIATIYHHTGHDELAESYVRLAMQDLHEDRSSSMLLYTDMMMSDILCGLEKYEEQLLHCVRWKYKLDQYNLWCAKNDKPTNLNTHYIYCYASHAMALIKSGRVALASIYVELAKGYVVGQNDKVQSHILHVESIYNESIGNSQKALALSDSNILILRSKNDPQALFVQMKERAEMMAQCGRKDQAVDLYRELLIHKDSLSNLDYSSIMEEFNINYIAQRLNRRVQPTYQYSIIITLLSLFLLATIFLYLYYLKRLKERNQILYQQNIDLQLNRDKVSVIPSQDINQASEPAKAWMSDMFAKVEDLMYNEKLYADPNLSRKLLAQKLRTNVVYLSDTIKYFTHGMTIGEYITDIRLKVAADLLINNKDMNINDIVYACGYVSRTTMFRQFRERYAMSPREYRASAN